MDKFLRVLRLFVPEFGWRVDKLALVDYWMPQTRRRVFLRGLRKVVATCVPDCLSPFGSRTLREVLGSFPNVSRETDITDTHQINLLAIEDTIRELVSAGRLQQGCGHIVVTCLDRAANKVYKQGITIDLCPTLTTKNRFIFLLSVDCVIADLPDSERDLFRWLMTSERLALQGFPPEILADFEDPDLGVFAAGNAYPIPLIIATTHPLLKAMACSAFNFVTWPADCKLGHPSSVPRFIGDARRALMAKPRRAKRRQPTQRRRKRSHSE